MSTAHSKQRSIYFDTSGVERAVSFHASGVERAVSFHASGVGRAVSFHGVVDPAGSAFIVMTSSAFGDVVGSRTVGSAVGMSAVGSAVGMSAVGMSAVGMSEISVSSSGANLPQTAAVGGVAADYRGVSLSLRCSRVVVARGCSVRDRAVSQGSKNRKPS